MCTTCAFEASKAVAATGGAGAVPALLAAAAAKVGADSLGQAVLKRGVSWITPRLVRASTILVVTAAATAATLFVS